jgi:hypothetical protein
LRNRFSSGSPVLGLVDFAEIKEFVGHASAMGTLCPNLNAEVDEVHAEQGKLVSFARSASEFVVPEHRASFSLFLSFPIGEFACLDQLGF